MKSKAEMMKRLRDERNAAGLVKVELWVTPSEREKVKVFIGKLRGETMA